MVKPNTERVVVKRIGTDDMKQGNILIPGQLKAGENLFVGRIYEAGDTKFKKDQVVYYSEYSAAAIYPLGDAILKGEALDSAMHKNEFRDLFVVAADDIMAYEDDTN